MVVAIVVIVVVHNSTYINITLNYSLPIACATVSTRGLVFVFLNVFVENN